MKTDMFRSLINHYLQTVNSPHYAPPANHSNAAYPPRLEIDNQKTSNITYREAEGVLLEKLGLPAHPQQLKRADAELLMSYLSLNPRLDPNITFDNTLLEKVEESGYSWRNNPALKNIPPETALYWDAYLRLREHDEEDAQLKRDVAKLFHHYQQHVVKPQQELQELRRRIIQS